MPVHAFDNYSYPPKLLSRTRELITPMLENVEPDAEAHEDAIDQAINSAKGKVIEALFIHTLRECRVKDKDVEEHHTIWSELRPIFDKELNKCKGTNFEFSALGRQLSYLSGLHQSRMVTEKHSTHISGGTYRKFFVRPERSGLYEDITTSLFPVGRNRHTGSSITYGTKRNSYKRRFA